MRVPLYLAVVCLVAAAASAQRRPSFELSLRVERYSRRGDVPRASRRFAQRADNTPANNPITDHGATLGRVLFYDKRLSKNRRISCASCHIQKYAFADPRRVSRGFRGQQGKRNAPSLVNARYYARGRFFWDERAATLEEQVLMPIQDKLEMGLDLDTLVARLRSDAGYRHLMKQAFGDGDVTVPRIANALAQFVRSLVSFGSRFDAGLREVSAIEDPFPNFSAIENRGKALFFGQGSPGVRGERGSCAGCHMSGGRGGRRGFGQRGSSANALFFGRSPTDNRLETGKRDDPGIEAVTKDSADRGRFKSPSLRNVELTAPYMHDGRFKDLDAVVRHYGRRFRRTGGFTSRERKALVAFLKTLTDSAFTTDRRFADPFRGRR
jgi:cytochrome c peroxidase